MKHSLTTKVLLIVLLLHFSFLCNSNEARRNSPSISVFRALHQILLNYDDCELLYLFESGTQGPISVNDFDMLALDQASSGARILSFFAPNVKYHRHQDIHRHTRAHCALAILIFNKIHPDIESWLFDTIIPRYGPIIRKDEDRFIFLTPTNKLADEVMLSSNFGEKIKYKIALHAENPDNLVECKTIDFYANNGNPVPKVLQAIDVLTSVEKSLDFSTLFPDMTKNFNGKQFRITVPNVKYRFEMEWRDGAYHPKRGFYKWWLDEAIIKFNFTYFMFWSSFEKATGKPLENGTWVGAAGDLLYDKADIAVIVGETYSRQPFFGFSAVLSYEWFFFMTHIPRNYYSPKAIFWPFTPLMWGLFFLSLILMTLSLKAIAVAGAGGSTMRKNKKWTYARMVDYIFTTFMEQDRDGPTSASSIRMLCAFWLLFSMVTSTAYRGKLVTLIAFPVDTWIPTDFEELANSNFKVALNNVGKVGAAHDLLSSSTNPVFQKLFHKMEMIGHPEICLMRALEEDLGCIIWEGISMYASVRNVTDKFGYAPLMQSKEIALFVGVGFAYERRAIFKHHMDRTIEAALQMGLTIKWLELDKQFIRRERRKWELSMHKPEVFYERDEGPKKLVISQFTGLFLISAFGLLIAGVRFGMELHQYRKEQFTNQEVEGALDNGKLNVECILVECIEDTTVTIIENKDIDEKQQQTDENRNNHTP
ncbi:unnamed protein product [Orchesella dallaii]|uniref:Ionotropic glutamate receptor C-terminal domain-containing protein n=1 Tax=Orchesella dallaii TaxID=48710 RepID=A0ABP1S5G5_9HEXA